MIENDFFRSFGIRYESSIDENEMTNNLQIIGTPFWIWKTCDIKTDWEWKSIRRNNGKGGKIHKKVTLVTYVGKVRNEQSKIKWISKHVWLQFYYQLRQLKVYIKYRNFKMWMIDWSLELRDPRFTESSYLIKIFK